jgi:hypothetical protein
MLQVQTAKGTDQEKPVYKCKPEKCVIGEFTSKSLLKERQLRKIDTTLFYILSLFNMIKLIKFAPGQLVSQIVFLFLVT